MKEKQREDRAFWDGFRGALIVGFIVGLVVGRWLL